MKTCLILAALFATFVFSQEYDPPSPYVQRPVEYSGYFQALHDELDQPLNGVVRTYYVAADEIVWDYAAHLNNDAAHTASDFWTTNSATAIGSRYHKAVYRQYTDETYSEPIPRPDWQGLMGPILRAEVGDTIEIHFWNRAAHNFSMHPHGVFYEFDMEGAVYKGTTETAFVHPGGRYTYTWQVAPRAGPGPADGNSLVWGYHSHVTELDIHAGLFGAIVIYRPGTLDEASMVIVTALFGLNENLSPYLQKTIDTLHHTLAMDEIRRTEQSRNLFYTSNIKQTVNGLISADATDLRLSTGVPVQWHLLGWGSEQDIEPVSWEDGLVELFDNSVKEIRLLPATFRTIAFTPSRPGVWGFGALTGEQGPKGMTMYYHVK
ncbi:Cupredoxin [Syncephalastrum racemosum]|uniref:Cupredoxin n=1 Tax=Syncephalastrum racemosum TaxID=13706 RepID=A0A1X2H4K7_SYNRA|nr:Cupredoxin [Syncephalastrum racemosum]